MNMKRSLTALMVLTLGCVCAVLGEDLPTVVPQEKMLAIYKEIVTPFKYGMVIEPAKGEKIDGPSVFRHKDQWCMVFIVFDGRGYETHLAVSKDLLHWERKGVIFPRGARGTWDQSQADAWPMLLNPAWEGDNTLQTFEGKYWFMYIGGARDGYETDPLSTGVAYTADPLSGNWTRYAGNPVLQPSDPTARFFEKTTIYKHFTVEDPSRRWGGRFVDFYNGKRSIRGLGNQEKIGMCVSDDLRHWTRVGDEPVIDDLGTTRPGISGDPCIRKIGDVWVMFYFGHRWGNWGGAFDTFACSYDLRNWTKWRGDALVRPTHDFDQTYAHKPWVLKHNGVVYHFYNAVGSRGRGLALATSLPLPSNPPRR